MASQPRRTPTRPGIPHSISRRRFLQGVGAAGGAFTLSPFVRQLLAQGSVLPPPAASGIEHVVVLMMENRSFDHMLGWLDGADGRQRGLKYLDAAGNEHRTYPLAPDFQG